MIKFIDVVQAFIVAYNIVNFTKTDVIIDKKTNVSWSLVVEPLCLRRSDIFIVRKLW